MKENIKLLKNNILIKEHIPEEKFGIKSEDLSVKATVISTGPDVTEVCEGDVIYISKYEGIPYEDMKLITPMVILGKEE
jgi:hypothetical protein